MTTLLLDVMSTLIHDPFPEEMLAHLGIQMSQLREVVQPELWVRFERDEVTEAQFYEGFFKDERVIDAASFRQMLFESYRFLPGIEELLAELKDADVPMHTMSNYPVWWHIIERKVEMSRYVDWTFVSCKLGVRKPDDGIYRAALEELGGRPDSFLFVDDRASNCDGARAVGMRALQFTGVDKLRAELVEQGVLPA